MNHAVEVFVRGASQSDENEVKVVVFPGFKPDLWGFFMRIVEAL